MEAETARGDVRLITAGDLPLGVRVRAEAAAEIGAELIIGYMFAAYVLAIEGLPLVPPVTAVPA